MVWYRLAARQRGDGEVEAWGAEQGDEELAWLHREAGQGNAGAQQVLGVMYTAGRVVARDEVEAVRWYRRAAEQGHAVARVSLGVMYADGRGVAQDDVKAHMWLDLAAARSTGELQESVIRSRDTVAQWMTLNQIAEAQRRAREWDTALPREP
jgi:TPR repeat protein